MKPHVIRLLRARYSPERLGQDALRGVSQLSELAGELPIQVQEILDDLRMGRLRLETHAPQSAKALEALGRGAYAGLVVAGLFILSGLALVADYPWVAGIVAGVAAARAGAYHLAASLRARK